MLISVIVFLFGLKDSISIEIVSLLVNPSASLIIGEEEITFWNFEANGFPFRIELLLEFFEARIRLRLTLHVQVANYIILDRGITKSNLMLFNILRLIPRYWSFLCRLISLAILCVAFAIFLLALACFVAILALPMAWAAFPALFPNLHFCSQERNSEQPENQICVVLDGWLGVLILVWIIVRNLRKILVWDVGKVGEVLHCCRSPRAEVTPSEPRRNRSVDGQSRRQHCDN